MLDPQIRTETGILAAQLAEAGSWLFPEDHVPPLARLREAEEELRLDAAFLAVFAQLRNNAFLADRMHDILQRKQADAEHLARIQH